MVTVKDNYYQGEIHMAKYNRAENTLKQMKENRYDAGAWRDEQKVYVDIGEFKNVPISIYNLTRKLSVNAWTKILDDFLNLGGKRWREGFRIGISMTRTHRTLQGNLVEFCLGILAGLAQQEHTDARNESAVALCKKITEMRDNGELDHQRYI